jgi:maltose alpha-D-glucosyltransferase/alpha-amylase
MDSTIQTKLSSGDPLWYKDAIMYEVHVRAFEDSNGDGIGDFRGLVQKLDYVEELGITTLWLLPFYPSPLRDDGYDIADYNSVHSSYGTLEDFRFFLDEAHRRGLRVMTELVVNHTSDQHPWFKEARQSRDNPKRSWYVWSDTPDLYSSARIIFTDTEHSNWAWDAGSKAYYWHRFFNHQPDLNYDNPAVREEVWNIMRFWLEQGVDGFRLDAVPYLVEREGTSCENLPETHEVLKLLRRRLDEDYPARFLLAEANQWPTDVRAYFGEGDECHMAFHFPLMPRMFMAVRLEDRKPVVEIMQRTPDIPESCQWGIFLRNHDELTLEMVTDEERDYLYDEYARDNTMRLNVGIRRRLAPLMENDRRRIELLHGMLFSLPGTPIVYYGDEIGMGDNVYLGDRNGVRTPMQWSGGWNAGFSTADPERLYMPLISNPVYGYQAINVESQRRSLHSLFSWMKRVIQIRKSTRVFSRGSLNFLSPANHRVLAYVRELGDEKVLVVNNLANSAQPVELDLQRFQGLIPIEMFGGNLFPRIGSRPYPMTLGPYQFFWFKLRRL